MNDLDTLTRIADQMADAAKAVSLPYFRAAGLNADNKEQDHFDPVTAADKEAEAAMRAVLAELRPDDSILGEEEADKKGTSGICWVLDPIDGTRSFISGMPTWGTLIGVNAGSKPYFGVMDQPYIAERYYGSSEKSWRTKDGQTQMLSTRKCAALDQATLMTTDPDLFKPETERPVYEGIAKHVQLKRYSADCYAYAMLANGTVDIVMEAGLNAYDIQAMIPIIEGAGGIITDWQGNGCQDGGQVLACGDPALHAVLLALINP